MHRIITLISRHGAIVVFVVAFLEQIGAPVPAIPVIAVATAMSSSTGTSLTTLLMLTIAGALVGDIIWFFLGERFGYKVLGLLCRISLSPDSCVRKTENFFERWGARSLLFAKFVPGFSLIAPPLAGAMKQISFTRFIIYDTIGAAIWAAAAVATGVIFRGAIDRVFAFFEDLGGWSLAFVGFSLAAYLLYKWWERQRFYRDLRMSRISPDELMQRMKSGATVILDVRSPLEQKRRPAAIPGAIKSTNESLEDDLRGIPRDQEIILYCT